MSKRLIWIEESDADLLMTNEQSRRQAASISDMSSLGKNGLQRVLRADDNSIRNGDIDK